MKQFNLEEYLKNPSRKVITKDGRNVKIHCTNSIGSHPVMAEIEGERYSYSYNKNGECFCNPSSNDLFFAPEKHEGWINVYKWGDDYRYTGEVFSSEERALMNVKGCDCVATIKIEWEE